LIQEEISPRGQK